jgi:hypothetical protein
MGQATFLLPDDISAEAARELERSFMAGGPDGMPWLTRAEIENGLLRLRRDVEESGFLVAPWDIPEAGRLMGATTTIMERERPYHFQLEMARGKVNQLRCQAEDWRAGGLELTSGLEGSIRDASLSFGRAILDPANDQTNSLAEESLLQSYRAARELAQAYVSQVFRVRHERDPQLDVTFGCRLGSVPPSHWATAYGEAFNSITVPFNWSKTEPKEGVYSWDVQDALINWADENSFPVTAGPLIDFSASQLPEWLWMWERDISSLARIATNYVSAAIKRYRDRIRRWHLASASNSASILSLTEEELLWLTVKIAQTARQLDPGLELITGIAQPWGDYMAIQDRSHSPFVFADTLIRTDLNLAALDIELVMGVTPRGSYCRDLLDTSRMLDLYALLGVPLRITIGYPSATARDNNADPELAVSGGHWQGEIDIDRQAEWGVAFTALAICKPYVQGVQWVHLADADSHQFPNCGLIDTSGKPKPALDSLRQVRKEHLR